MTATILTTLIGLTLGAFAAYLFGHARGVRLERGRHIVQGHPTMPTIGEIVPGETTTTTLETGPIADNQTRLRINIGIVAGPRSTFPISQGELRIADFDGRDVQVASALRMYAEHLDPNETEDSGPVCIACRRRCG